MNMGKPKRIIISEPINDPVPSLPIPLPEPEQKPVLIPVNK